MLIMANFSALDDLTSQIKQSLSSIQNEMDTWQNTAGATSANWLDNAGGAFGQVNQAWKAASAAGQQMLDVLGSGVAKANMEMQQALATSTSRVQATASPA